MSLWLVEVNQRREEENTLKEDKNEGNEMKNFDGLEWQTSRIHIKNLDSAVTKNYEGADK